MTKCNHRGTVERSERHDAHYCSKCDVWIEGNCSDPECCFCKKRPEKPSMVAHHKLMTEEDWEEHEEAVRRMTKLTMEEARKLAEKMDKEADR